jgi:serine phosphatase RsbU (regulator of sigma subunit)
MEHAPHVIPSLATIARSTDTVSSATTVKEVIAIFQDDSTLLALPVTEDGMFAGVVNRKTLFFKHLGRPFAMDLYAKKPIQVLLEEPSFSMEPQLDINSALARLLAADPALAMDSFPVVSEGRCLGMVSVSDLMMTISQNQSLLLETLNEMGARLRDEVAKASIIQRALLPAPEFNFSGMSLSADVITSSEIGGDLYDYFCTEDGRLGLVIADVSGHGVQSGMVTTAAKASLHTLISQGTVTPARLLQGMNHAILATARQSLLMTCLIVVIDPTRGCCTLANAGHNYPYLCRAGEIEPAMLSEVAGFPLGFEPDSTYPELSIPLAAGDTLLLYTDGIVECTNREDEEFGYARLESFLRTQMRSRPKDLKQLLLEEVQRFTGTTAFADDVTLLVARVDAIDRKN